MTGEAPEDLPSKATIAFWEFLSAIPDTSMERHSGCAEGEILYEDGSCKIVYVGKLEDDRREVAVYVVASPIKPELQPHAGCLVSYAVLESSVASEEAKRALVRDSVHFE